MQHPFLFIYSHLSGLCGWECRSQSHGWHQGTCVCYSLCVCVCYSLCVLFIVCVCCYSLCACVCYSLCACYSSCVCYSLCACCYSLCACFCARDNMMSQNHGWHQGTCVCYSLCACYSLCVLFIVCVCCYSLCVCYSLCACVVIHCVCYSLCACVVIHCVCIIHCVCVCYSLCVCLCERQHDVTICNMTPHHRYDMAASKTPIIVSRGRQHWMQIMTWLYIGQHSQCEITFNHCVSV